MVPVASINGGSLFQIFDFLRVKDPKFSEKLVPVEVDYSTYDLNIDSDLLGIIQDEVQVEYLNIF